MKTIDFGMSQGWTARLLALSFFYSLCSLLSGGHAFAESELRVFKDGDGREILAAIVAATASDVSIRMENGKTFTLPHSKFSEEDQKFIGEWLKANPQQIRYNFDIDPDKKRIDKRKRETTSHEITEEDWIYTLKINNRSSADVEELEVQYRIYFSDAEAGSQAKKKLIRTAKGAETLSGISKSRGAEVITNSVTLVLSDLDGDYAYTDGSDDKQFDKLEGLWVKLFHRGNKVGEYKSSDAEVKKQVWPDDEKAAPASSKSASK